MTITIDPTLPAVPRSITPRGRHRAWAEQPVRVWMILSLLLLIGIVYVLVNVVPEGIAERRIIYHGQQVTATLKDIGENHDGDPRHTVRTNGSNDERTVTLVYPGGPAEGSMRELQTSRFQDKRPGDTVVIRYDPEHPENWTDLTQPLSWFVRLEIFWILFLVFIATMFMVLFRRKQFLRVWQSGQPMQANVIGVQQSAIAPRSKLIRFTIEGTADRRVRSTFLPNSAGQVIKGDQVLVLALPNDPSRAIIAALYE